MPPVLELEAHIVHARGTIEVLVVLFVLVLVLDFVLSLSP